MRGRGGVSPGLERESRGGLLLLEGACGRVLGRFAAGCGSTAEGLLQCFQLLQVGAGVSHLGSGLARHQPAGVFGEEAAELFQVLDAGLGAAVVGVAPTAGVDAGQLFQLCEGALPRELGIYYLNESFMNHRFLSLVKSIYGKYCLLR